MKKESIYILVTAGIVNLFSSCAPTIQTYDLSDEYATSLHIQASDDSKEATQQQEEGDLLVGIPAANFYGGDLKRGGIWWAGKGITLEKGDVFVIDAVGVGTDSTNNPFGATFPPIDLVKEPSLLKVVARAEGENGSSPELFMQVDDANGFKADAKRPSQKIEHSTDSTGFKEYYFELRDIYMQAEPKHKVSGGFINSVKFFINPGQTPFTGKIYISEIKVVSAKSVGK